MSAPETTSVATRSNQGTVAPKEALKLRLDLNLEVEIAIQAKVNGDITLSLLKWSIGLERRYFNRICWLHEPIIMSTTFFLSFVSPFIMLY
ncbi:hypothetical protein EDD85DRAFT_956145 [Armillaria nabsnona]|nr:hypothetical protein EDD85DRAFT_956145 [Armillaria nabsnona]